MSVGVTRFDRQVISGVIYEIKVHSASYYAVPLCERPFFFGEIAETTLFARCLPPPLPIRGETDLLSARSESVPETAHYINGAVQLSMKSIELSRNGGKAPSSLAYSLFPTRIKNGLQGRKGEITIEN